MVPILVQVVFHIPLLIHKILSYYNSVRKNNRLFLFVQGFTLIEMLIVLSLIGTLTSLGIASYSSYNSTQVVLSASTNVEDLLAEAHSQAISQVIPSSCGSNSLSGYQINVTPNGQQYTLSAICGFTQVISTNSLPSQLSFGNGSNASIIFNASTGTIATPATIQITGFGKTHTISISTSGDISMN